MSLNDDSSDLLITRYLLGQLGQDVRQEFEERYFAEDNLFARLVEVENSLIRQYAEDRLSPEDRERFEGLFLVSPDRRRRVESAKAAARRRRSGQEPS